MTEPMSHLVHTDEAALAESATSGQEAVQSHRRERSSAGERLLHTQDVAGSIPAVPTVPDRLAEMLANDQWRMKVESRFWPKVMKPLDWSACWIWTGSSNKGRPKNDYGNFRLRSHISARAHRVSYALFYNRSPGALLVCHHCDNPRCVNPHHLFLGTVQDNSDDMMRKGRWKPLDQTGEKNGAAKLSAADVLKVRDLIAAGLNNKMIAARFGVTHQAISRIRRGRSWGDAPMQPKYASLRARRS